MGVRGRVVAHVADRHDTGLPAERHDLGLDVPLAFRQVVLRHDLVVVQQAAGSDERERRGEELLGTMGQVHDDVVRRG